MSSFYQTKGGMRVKAIRWKETRATHYDDFLASMRINHDSFIVTVRGCEFIKFILNCSSLKFCFPGSFEKNVKSNEPASFSFILILSHNFFPNRNIYKKHEHSLS
jgi:hypothetical protein